MIQQKLIDKFGDQINQMSCVYIGDGENSLRHFLEGKKFSTIIEIGTYQGVSTAILSEYAKKVHAIDIVDLPLRNQIWNFLGVKNAEFHHIEPDLAQKKELMDKIFDEEKVDLIFIDGDHWGTSLQDDFDVSKKCDKLLIHDYEPSFPIVYDFCNNIQGYEKESKNLFCMLTEIKNNKKNGKKPSKSKNNTRG